MCASLEVIILLITAIEKGLLLIFCDHACKVLAIFTVS